MIEIYKNLDTTKNAQKVLNNKSKEPKAYRQSILSNIKKVGTIKKSDKNIKAAQKSFEILNMESTQIILDDGDKNSIESNGVGTSSLGNNDHNFVDVLQCIQKA